MSTRAEGSFLHADFFDSSGGINTTDSPFRLSDSQSTGGINFEYAFTGGFQKKLGATKLNSSANAATRYKGGSLHVTTATVKTPIVAASAKIQSANLTTGVTTNLSEDTTTATTDLLSSGSTQPVVFAQFNNPSADLLWCAGGGATLPVGVYSTTKATTNGVPVPTGSFTATRAAAGGGTWASTGTYFYSVVYRKTSTQALSNAGLDVSATVTVVTDKVTIDLTSLSNMDTAKYDKVYLYRSAVGGVTSFTTGDLVAQITAGTTTYDDTGTYLSTAQNVPRAGNTLLDNSVLPSGTYNVATVWKRRLVTAAGSTLYFSDLNKSESWPTANVLTVPSGGAITGLAIISFTTPTSNSIDELLVVFKEQELWVVTGTTISDWALKFIDTVGCPNQPLICSANGYLSWVDYRGVYLWDGSAKPIYCSRPIESYFDSDGEITKSSLALGWGTFVRSKNQILWTLTDSVYGANKFTLKLDVRLTIPAIQTSLGGRIIDGVFSFDSQPASLFFGTAMNPDTTEIVLAGDGSGYLYKLLNDIGADSGSAITFQYDTKPHDMGTIGKTKRFHKVIVWTQNDTDSDLTLEYWCNYGPAFAGSAVTAPMSISVSAGNWDEGYWDAFGWDISLRGFAPRVFNLPSGNEGTCIKMRFSQSTIDTPTTIAGYTVLYSEGAFRL